MLRQASAFNWCDKPFLCLHQLLFCYAGSFTKRGQVSFCIEQQRLWTVGATTHYHTQLIELDKRICIGFNLIMHQADDALDWCCYILRCLVIRRAWNSFIFAACFLEEADSYQGGDIVSIQSIRVELNYFPTYISNIYFFLICELH